MAARRDGGANQQVISLNGIIENTVMELNDIEASTDSQSVKTKRFKRLADKIKNQLHDDGRKKASIALTTYKRYMTMVRNAIKATGRTHHSLQSTVAREGTLTRVMKDYPEYAALLAPLKTEHAETIGAMKAAILATIQADKDNKRRSKAYTAVKQMATDHELMYHLTMDDVQKADLDEQAAESLSEKKNNAVALVHADIQKIIIDGISSESYTRRAFALALASGRRAIEILYTASFQHTGEHTVLFDGQAKKQAGIESAAYEIYTLIPAADFIQSFNTFRKMESVTRLDEDFGSMDREQRNTEINKRTAKTMNEAAKTAMNDKDRMFKDSRAIYTRICFDTYFKTDSKWAGADEDVFAKHLLGHGDYSAQAHYKQFKVDYSAPAAPEAAAPEAAPAAPAAPAATAVETRSKELKAAGKLAAEFVKNNPARGAVAEYHALVVQWASANPTRKITFSALYKKDKGGVGGNRDTIKDYLEAAKEPIEQYNGTR